MKEDREELGPREVRSPIQVVVRVLLALVIVVVLIGFFFALFRRAERGVRPGASAYSPPASVQLESGGLGDGPWRKSA